MMMKEQTVCLKIGNKTTRVKERGGLKQCKEGRRFVLCKGKQSREKDRQEKEIQSDNRFISVVIVSEKKETG